MEEEWIDTPHRRSGPTEPPVEITPDRGAPAPIFQSTTVNRFGPFAESEAIKDVATQTEPESVPPPVPFGTNLIATAAAYIIPNQLFASRILSVTTTRPIPQEIGIQAQPIDISTLYTTSPLLDQATHSEA